jgi:ABC-type sugar transport system permease subunit
MRRPGRLAVCLAAIASVSLVAATAAVAAAPTPDEDNLVRAYAPILELRAQEDPGEDPCDTTEEQYNPPTWVEVVLGNPRVKLVHHMDGRDVVVKTAPTAADVAGLNEDYYLDLPADPLSPHCDYAKDYANLRDNRRAPEITYAHIARETGHSGLVVQYWFFYYFNQFNDVHEGDWEGMQISFDADTPAQALADGPSQIALFQHAGGERADWDDSKVQKEDTHPIVYPAAGSHATFYDHAIYIQNGQNGSGVGCDNTSEPLTRAQPQPIIVPTHGPPGSEFQWLSYLGHWGQREKGFNNGPTGPVTKSQWLEPFTWMDGIRQDSPRLPAGTILGPAASTAFCGAIAGVSEFINLEAKDTLGAIGLAVALLLLIVIPPLLTRWRPVDISQLQHRWRVGQLLRGARQLYGRHWRTMLLFALTGFVILGAIQGLEYLFTQANNGNQDFTVGISPGGLDLKFGGSPGALAEPIGSAIVSGIVVAFMRLLVSGEQHGFMHCWRAMYDRLWRVVVGQLAAEALLLLLVITLIGIPVAAYLYVAWQFIQQEIMFEDRSIRDSFHGSSSLVRGRWWRTLRVAAILTVISVVVGPVLGFFLIFLNFSPILVNLIGSAVFALLIPYVAIGRTLLYFDLKASEEAEEAAGLTRRYWFSRPRPATQAG